MLPIEFVGFLRQHWYACRMLCFHDFVLVIFTTFDYFSTFTVVCKIM